MKGFKVVGLGSLSIIGFLLASQRVAAVVVDEASVPEDWPAMRERLSRIAAATAIVVVTRDDPRSVAELVEAAT